MKVLGPTADYPTWGSSKGTENPQGIWLWRSAGFDYRTSTGLAKQILGEHKQNLVFPRRQEQWPHVRLSQTCLWVLRSLRRRHGLTLAYCRVRGTCASISPFGRPLGQTRSQTQLHPSTEYWIKDLLSMALPIRAKSSFPHSWSLPSGRLHKYPHQSEGRQNENHSHRKLTKMITWITALCNLMKLWATPVGPCKTDSSWWRILTKHGSWLTLIVTIINITIIKVYVPTINVTNAKKLKFKGSMKTYKTS